MIQANGWTDEEINRHTDRQIVRQNREAQVLMHTILTDTFTIMLMAI